MIYRAVWGLEELRVQEWRRFKDDDESQREKMYKVLMLYLSNNRILNNYFSRSNAWCRTRFEFGTTNGWRGWHRYECGSGRSKWYVTDSQKDFISEMYFHLRRKNSNKISESFICSKIWEWRVPSFKKFYSPDTWDRRKRKFEILSTLSWEISEWYRDKKFFGGRECVILICKK